MDIKTSSRLGAIALAIALAGCAGSPPPARETVALRAPPARELESRAAAFAGFMRQARNVDPAFASPADVSRAQDAAAYDPASLEAGMVAFVAAAALQEPGFVAGATRTQNARVLAARLAADPNLVLGLPGAGPAAARASDALFRQGQALAQSGEKVKKASYLVQHQSWSRAMVPNARGQLDRVKRLSEAGYRIGAGDQTLLREVLAASGRRDGPPSPVVTRGLALAALSALGEDARGHALMSDPHSGMCLHMAKLNLYQCIASAGPHYEDIYCLGQHAMMETAQCVVDATRPARAPPARIVKASYRP
jgi:hypothetical protein